jgi:GAF domain-containing protein
MASTASPVPSPQQHPDRVEQIRAAVETYAVATSQHAQPELLRPLTFLLAQVRHSLGVDVVFVSRFVDRERVFEVVSAEGDAASRIVPGVADPLLDTYCQRIVDGRLPAIIADTSASAEAAALQITRALNIHAYLSAPVILPNGHVFGTVCCISHKIRPDLRDADAQALASVAQAVAASVTKGGTLRYAAWTPPP